MVQPTAAYNSDLAGFIERENFCQMYYVNPEFLERVG